MSRRTALCIPILAGSLALGACDEDSTGAGRDFLDCPIQTIAIPGGANGLIGNGDCEVEIEGEEKFVDVYRFTLGTTRNVAAGVFAADDELDAYLYLYNENGVLLAENDDYDLETLDAVIFEPSLPPGEYFLVASSLATSVEAPDDHGAYTIETDFYQ